MTSKYPPAVQREGHGSEGRPLSGLRVVELTTAWAGPMAGAILARMGAEVIHVESAGNLDSWRFHGQVFTPRRYPDSTGGERPYNRTSLFNSQNLDKLSLSLDVKAPGGQQVLLDLIAQADALIANYTPGMLDRLGLSRATLQALKPDLVIVEMPGFGNDGPMRAWTALGPTMEQMAGMTAMVGYGDGRPVSTGPAYLDPIGGLHGAAAALTALLHRQRSGEGQHVEVPQVEAAMHLVGEHLLKAAESGRDPVVDANRVPHAAPHDVFPTRGDDEWVVIDVASEAQWQALCGVVGEPSLAADARFATLAQRLLHEQELREALSAWTRSQHKHALAARLQDAGVPAAAVYKADDTLACEYLNVRGFSTPLTHPEAGRHLHQGMPYRFEKMPLHPRHAAPCLGEHNHHILRHVLGRTAAQIDELERAGTIRSAPDH